MVKKINSFFTRYEFLIPLFVFIFFLVAAMPGITWGAPALWNPDELVWRVDQALKGHIQFDVTEPDFNYPSMPKTIMYVIGSVTYGLGFSEFAFIVSARIFSGILGALVGVLVYLVARNLGAGKFLSILAGLLYITSGVVSANSRFAHNDLYLQFFTFLCLYFVIKFHYTNKLIWLFASFVIVGMAASSKYTGASMVLLPVSVVVFMHWKYIRSNIWRFFGILTLGAFLVIIGYAIGTPRLLIAPMDYLTKAIPAALRFSQYGFNSGTPIGLYGQWNIFQDSVGVFQYYLFLGSFAWFALKLVLHRVGKMELKHASGITILVINIVLFDLPFLVSINYIPRHFIPFVPLFAVLAVLFLKELMQVAKIRNWNLVPPVLVSLVFAGMVYSALRLVSIALLFSNDARIHASDYISQIRGYGKSIEYTLYPPQIERKRFSRAHNYPIYFVKYEDDVVPTGGRYEYNLGEQGLLQRNTDYFVIDSYTYDRFYTPSICETNPVECEFFKELMAGEVESYRLLAEFKYRLPAWLPQVSVSAVNPDILIYERVP